MSELTKKQHLSVSNLTQTQHRVYGNQVNNTRVQKFNFNKFSPQLNMFNVHFLKKQLLKYVEFEPTPLSNDSSCRKFGQKVYSTTYSQAVTHTDTNPAIPCLTSVTGRAQVCCGSYRLLNVTTGYYRLL